LQHRRSFLASKLIGGRGVFLSKHAPSQLSLAWCYIWVIIVNLVIVNDEVVQSGTRKDDFRGVFQIHIERFLKDAKLAGEPSKRMFHTDPELTQEVVVRGFRWVITLRAGVRDQHMLRQDIGIVAHKVKSWG
jgi:hypothetical protein